MHALLLLLVVWFGAAPAIAATMLCNDGCECCNPQQQPAAASPSCCDDEAPAPERSPCPMYLTDDHGNNSVALPNNIALTPHSLLENQNAAPVAEMAVVRPNYAAGIANISLAHFPRSAPIYLQIQSFLC